MHHSALYERVEEERQPKLHAEGWSRANFGNEKRQSESHLEPNVCEARLLIENAANWRALFLGSIDTINLRH